MKLDGVDAVDVTIILGWIMAVGFPAVYSRVRWWSTVAGRSAMTFSIVVAIVMTLAALRAIGYDTPEWVRGFAFVLILGGLATQFLSLLRVQYRRRDRAPLGDRQLHPEESR